MTEVRAEGKARAERLQISRWVATAFVLGTFTLAVLNVLLIHQNRELKKTTITAKQSKYLSPGDTVPPLRGLDAEGQQIKIDYASQGSSDHRKTIVLVFSPKCGWCDVNLPNWHAILDSLDYSRYRVVAVSTDQDGLAKYLSENNLSEITLVQQPAPQDRKEYKMNTTPMTLVVGNGGVIEKVWAGAFWPHQQKEVENFFGVELPGISEAA
ncbi:MAG: hypothetical protein AAF560_18505 [Acidobacteriota bacterium]